MKQVLLLLITYIGLVHGDMYLHALRGSNNRLDEANRERNNANRLFDSQNNNRGGYNVGKLNIYEKEEVVITWTNQHGCNSNDTKHCEVIVQAMCDPLIRDGTTTERIPTNPAQCQNFNCDLDVKFGRHESYAWYEQCQNTERNKGLFLASQKLNQDRATRTRQNPGGTRRGYECPEERDYWPYWRPSPWKDIVVFTKEVEKCDLLTAESENVKSRWYCQIPEGVELGNNQRIPITKEKCEEMEFSTNDGANVTNARWLESAPNGWPKPACVPAEATRPNHLGLIGHTSQWSYKWTVPETLKNGDTEQTCVLRFRYNITQDYDASLKNEETGKFDTLNPGNMTSMYNSAPGGNAGNSPSWWPLWEKFGIPFEDVECSFRNNDRNCNDEDSREYVLVNNPQVRVLPEKFGDKQVKLQLAVNTAQYGRTFQDRTHAFTWHKKHPDVGENQRMKMLTVSGKRGNIVQTFPGHEYFFIPEVMHLRQGDYLHVEISGSDTNPNNNDGQGRKGTDRSNICPLKNENYVGGKTMSDPSRIGAAANNYPAFVLNPSAYNIPQIYKGKPRALLNEAGEETGETEEVICRQPDHYTPPIGGLTSDQAASLCTGRLMGKDNSDYGNMEELDDMGTAHTHEPMQVTETGCWNYVSTRNNNFSNRSQKGTLCVDRGEFNSNDIGYMGGAMMTEDGWLAFPTGSLDTIYSIEFSSHPSDGGVSPIIKVDPEDLGFAEGQSGELGIDYNHRALRNPKVMYKPHGGNSWSEKSATFTKRDGKTVALVSFTASGYYKVEDELNGGAVAAISVICVVLVLVLCGVLYCQVKGTGEGNDLQGNLN